MSRKSNYICFIDLVVNSFSPYNGVNERRFTKASSNNDKIKRGHFSSERLFGVELETQFIVFVVVKTPKVLFFSYHMQLH